MVDVTRPDEQTDNKYYIYVTEKPPTLVLRYTIASDKQIYIEMLVIWWCILASAAAHRVVESIEDSDPATASLNTTTLFPVKPGSNDTNSKQKTATSWKIETTFGEAKLDSNSTDSKEELVLERPLNSSQEFKPSQHLGNFLDESYEGPTRATFDGYLGGIKKPASGFISSLRENKIPKEVFKQYHQFPYKLESPILTKAKDGWRPAGGSSIESRPTDEAPVKVPAGGLYQLPDPFRVKPGTTDEDFGLEFTGDAKEHAIKKRVNPWRSLLHLLTALIPVGIIVSALTPSIITIEPDHSIPQNVFRRAGGSFASVADISERCRRRLLCELHAQTNYQSGANRRPKLCHRIHCEDPEALTRTLQWLLSHSPNSGLTGTRPTGGLNKLTNGQKVQKPIKGNIESIHRLPTSGQTGQRPTAGHTSIDYHHPFSDDSGDQFTTEFT